MKRSKINPVSKRRRIELAEYRVARVQFLKAHPFCEVCGSMAEHVHHKQGRQAKRLLDSRYFASLCESCHMFVHANPAKARELGLMLDRLGQNPIKNGHKGV